MDIPKTKLGTLICLVSLYFVPSVAAQRPNPQGGPSAQGDMQAEARDNVEHRIKRQRGLISRGIEQGTITKQQAVQFKATLDELEAKVNTQKQANGGELKPEQLKQAETKLNENFRLIHTNESAGKTTVQSGKVLGPDWTPGPDGAQKAGSLIKKMKQEERRELRQEEQTNAQKLEQQQLEYERQMMPKMGNQRKNILQQKQNLDQVRQESGANGNQN